VGGARGGRGAKGGRGRGGKAAPPGTDTKSITAFFTKQPKPEVSQ
jgi:hypothetical protein